MERVAARRQALFVSCGNMDLDAPPDRQEFGYWLVGTVGAAGVVGIALPEPEEGLDDGAVGVFA
jgi:hypothetical protein